MKTVSRKIAITLVSLFCICAVISCSAGSNTSSPSLQILNHSLNTSTFSTSSPQSVATVTGTAQNAGVNPIQTAIITVNFYDKDGKLMDTLTATRDNLVRDEIWIFAIQSSGADAWKITRYAISASTK